MTDQSVLRTQLESMRAKLDKACSLAADMGNTFRHLDEIWQRMAEVQTLIDAVDNNLWNMSQRLHSMGVR